VHCLGILAEPPGKEKERVRIPLCYRRRNFQCLEVAVDPVSSVVSRKYSNKAEVQDCDESWFASAAKAALFNRPIRHG
jgi:hypothetical protein